MDYEDPRFTEYRTRYGVNTTLRIREHVPPEPFTGRYGKSPRPPVDWSRWDCRQHWKADRLGFALAYPPLETEPPGAVERTLTVTGVKTLRTDGGPNVVSCFLDGDPSTEYIAKIFDGIDYPWASHRDTLMGDLDCMSAADLDYSIEAWAYRIIQPLYGGTYVPTYYGSWTFAVGERWVRMILLELIQGESVQDMLLRAKNKDKPGVDYARLPPDDFRIRVLKNVEEARLFIWWYACVTHEDLIPRNVIVKPDGTAVIIDFNNALISKFDRDFTPQRVKDNFQRLPPSMIEQLWPPRNGYNPVQEPWMHWMPRRWVENPILAAEWVVETYRDDPRFAAPAEHWLEWEKHEKWCERGLRLLESLGRKPTKPAASEVSGTDPSRGLTE